MHTAQRPALSCIAALAGLLLLSSAPAPSLPAPSAPNGPGNDETRAKAASISSPGACFTIEDFENYEAGDAPDQWYTNKGRDLTPANEQSMSSSHRLSVKGERGNKFVRMQMQGYAYRLIKLSGKHFQKWNTSACPVLSWRWRVEDYPDGADETDEDNNDVAAAVYVTFGRDWLGRPKSIKYTFSSTQPVGTTASYGKLKVLVVASAGDGSPTGEWMSIRRNVVKDYKNLFGEAPDDDTPVGIQLFSDADVSAERTAVADFDDVRVMQQK